MTNNLSHTRGGWETGQLKVIWNYGLDQKKYIKKKLEYKYE